MAESQGLIGLGIHLARGDGASPEVFTNVAELVDLSPPSMTKEQVEATHTDSPDGFREYIGGLKDGGEFSATMNYVPGNATQGNASGGLLNDFLTQSTPRNWRVTFPGSPAMMWTFKAVVTGYEVAPPIDDRVTLTATFRVAGAVTPT
jgi:predicted secreted protein